jgi:hypothetical protein
LGVIAMSSSFPLLPSSMNSLSVTCAIQQFDIQGFHRMI